MEQNMENIKSFDDACKALGIEPKVPDFSFAPEGERKALEAHYKLTVIARALNEGWVPDWGNDEYDKYYPWFDMGGSSGAGFSYDGCDFVFSASRVGSRLAYKNSELAEYAGRTFVDLYKDYFVIQ